MKNKTGSNFLRCKKIRGRKSFQKNFSHNAHLFGILVSYFYSQFSKKITSKNSRKFEKIFSTRSRKHAFQQQVLPSFYQPLWPWPRIRCGSWREPGHPAWLCERHRCDPPDSWGVLARTASNLPVVVSYWRASSPPAIWTTENHPEFPIKRVFQGVTKTNSWLFVFYPPFPLIFSIFSILKMWYFSKLHYVVMKMSSEFGISIHDFCHPTASHWESSEASSNCHVFVFEEKASKQPHNRFSKSKWLNVW